LYDFYGVHEGKCCVMIRFFVGENGMTKEVDKRQHGCWAMITPPFEQGELEALASTYGVPIEYIVDSLDIDERSRYEVEDEVRLIVVNAPVPNEEKHGLYEAIYITAPIGIIPLDDITLTLSRLDSPALTRFVERRVKDFDPGNQGKFILQIFEQTNYIYLDNLKKLNLKRYLIENELYNSSRNEELKQLLQIEKSLVYFVTALRSNELLFMKMKRTDFLQLGEDEFLLEIFDDVIIDNSQALEMANVYTNILSGTMETYASIISNNLNMYINRLSVIAIVLMVPTLVSSFYGMNVALPLQDNPYAFYILFFVSLVMTFIFIYFLRKKNLL